MASLLDESSDEFIPALKKENDRLLAEQASAQTMHDHIKSMELRLQQRIEDKMGGLEDTFKNMIASPELINLYQQVYFPQPHRRQ